MRIFVDCSYVDFSRQPTGIPRVVLKYVEVGYDWGAQHGVDVVPVVTTEKGLFPVRPLPGEGPPPNVQRYVKPNVENLPNGSAAVGNLRKAEDALAAALIDAGSPLAVDKVSSSVAALFSQLASGADELLQIAVQPGDIIFYPAYWHDIPPKHIKALQQAGAKVYILVHDILPITFGKFYHAPWRYEFADNLLEACSYADGLFAVSSYTARSVEEYGRANGAAVKRIQVSHNGFDPLIEDPELRCQLDSPDYRIPLAKRKTYDFFTEHQPYLIVGTIEPKKGHIPAIKAFEALWNRGLSRPLVLIGRTGWMEAEVVRTIRSSLWFEEKLFWFDHLSDADLYWAYRHSRALIFASYAEGFGIPLIEAAQAGLPALCFDTEVAREVASDSALFYANAEQFWRHILELEEDFRWQEERDRLTDYHWPSWNEIGNRLFDRLSAEAAN